MNIKKTILNVTLIMLTVVLTLTACNSDSDLTSTRGKGLWIKPAVAGATETRAVGDDVPADASLNENALQTLDVFIGKDGQFTKMHKRFSSNLTTTEGTLQVGDDNWETVYNEPPYEIYIVANATDATTPNITTQTDLAAKTQTDDDIYAPYTGSKDKTFLMDGKLDSWTPDKDNIATVELRRAAAKIVVKFEFSEAMAAAYTRGAIQWKMLDYTTTASLIAEGETDLTAGTGDTGNTLFQADGTTITTYSYPCKWTNSDEAPRLLVNIPLTSVEDGKVKANNWYSIPVRDLNGTEKQLDRNHIYYVDATISSQGSATELINSQDVKLKYRAIDWKDVYEADWKDDDVDVDATKTDYFMVYPTTVTMRNVSTDNSVEYYASEDVTIVVDNVYYYDKNGDKQTIDNSTVSISPDESDKKKGKITIESPVPTNLTVRYFKFTVSACGKSQQVTVKQYPLEYIQNIEGLYSTRDLDSWIVWKEKDGTYSDQYFKAKVYDEDDDKIYDYKTYNSHTGSESFSGQNNNHMYVVQITKTSDKYVIGHPSIDNTGLSDDDVVSPAFMLASQLGTVTAFSSGTDAATHCKTYKEVGKDGTPYDHWRLPTPSEIGVIINYQNKEDAPMDNVIIRYYYWTADGKKTYNAQGSGSSNGFVRCVRDLKEGEIQQLEAKE